MDCVYIQILLKATESRINYRENMKCVALWLTWMGLITVLSQMCLNQNTKTRGM